MYNEKLKKLGEKIGFNGKHEYYKVKNKIVRFLNVEEEWIEYKDDIFWIPMKSEDFYNKMIEFKMIEVKWIKRPKNKPIKKLKIYGETYYITDVGDNLVSFVYKSYSKDKVKNEVIASIFNKNSCKGESLITLTRIYNDEINKFNKEKYIHSQYITSVIIENVFKIINNMK